MNQPASLFSPLRLRDISLRNRIGVSPMCQYSSDDGYANDWHLVHLGARATGGAGLVLSEACAVSPEGRISPHDLGLWKDGHVESLARCTRFIRAQGAVAGIQLAHAGRKASTAAPWRGGGPVGADQQGWLPVAPSPLAFASGYPVPAALDRSGIARIAGDFVSAARRAGAAGFEMIEIHAAHGYLLHQFLSPLTNRRTDDYGGSFENRTRLVREVTAAIRQIWPDRLPLLIRVSATDWAEGGWDAEQTIELIRMLKPLGIDLVDCSTGGLVPHSKIPVGPGFQVPFAARIRQATGVPTAAVGLIREPAQADEIVREGHADLVLLAREFLRDPQWPLHAARQLGVQIAWPVQYQRASD